MYTVIISSKKYSCKEKEIEDYLKSNKNIYDAITSSFCDKHFTLSVCNVDGKIATTHFKGSIIFRCVHVEDQESFYVKVEADSYD